MRVEIEIMCDKWCEDAPLTVGYVVDRMDEFRDQLSDVSQLNRASFIFVDNSGEDVAYLGSYSFVETLAGLIRNIRHLAGQEAILLVMIDQGSIFIDIANDNGESTLWVVRDPYNIEKASGQIPIRYLSTTDRNSSHMKNVDVEFFKRTARSSFQIDRQNLATDVIREAKLFMKLVSQLLPSMKCDEMSSEVYSDLLVVVTT